MQQESNFSSTQPSETKRRSSNPVCHNMEHEGIVFPVKKKNISTQPSFFGMVPSSVDKGEEQLKMVMEFPLGKQRNGNDLITGNIGKNNGSRGNLLTDQTSLLLIVQICGPCIIVYKMVYFSIFVWTII